MRTLLLLSGLLLATHAMVQAQPAPPSAVSDFSLKLFRDLAGGAEGKNVFISPSSISTALRMAMEGAAGQTLEAMRNVLGPAPSTLSTPSTPSTSDATGVNLEVANSLWVNPSMPVIPAYVELVKRQYDALARTIAFGTPEAPAAINRWVAGRTHDKIDKIVGDLGADTVMVLVNAIYFKGKWFAPFKEESTQDAPFRRPNGGETTVKMMRQSGRFDYQRGSGFQAIRLSYGSVPAPRPEGMPADQRLPPRPGPIEMIIVLPDAADGLPGLIRDFDGARWNQLLGGFTNQEGAIALPRFKAEFEDDLVQALKRLGMAPAFDPDQADFSKMVQGGGAFISQVRHKAVVEVNEEGTEAAAATAVVMALTAMPAEPPFEMVVDHPFLFAIRDSRNGEILFLGAITAP